MQNEPELDELEVDAVVISGSEPPAWALTVGAILGIGLASVGGLLLVGKPEPAGVALVVGGTFLVVMILGAQLYYRARRKSLIPLARGFVYLTSRGERRFNDDDVMCISYVNKPQYNSGQFTGMKRRFCMWLETTGAPERVVITHSLKPGQNDPLQGFIERVINGLHAAAKSAYEQNLPVEGQGWTLVKGELLYPDKKITQVISVNEITAVDVVEDRICVWRRGQDLPVVRVPEETANAHLLILLLQNLIPEQAEEDEHKEGLGRILFERRTGSWPVATALILALTLCLALPFFLLGVGLVITGIATGDLGHASIGLLLLLGSSFSCWLIWLAWKWTKSVFRCHMRGIQRKGIFSARELRYEDLASFTHASTRVYVNGVYTGTTIHMTFTPVPSTGQKALTYSTNIRADDAELERLREHVSQVIAHNMLQVWKQSQNVPWTPYLRFTAQGLEYRALSLLGRKAAQVVSYRDIENFDVQNGELLVWKRGQKKPLFQEQTSQPNFYPGLKFLIHLWQQRNRPEDVLEEVM